MTITFNFPYTITLIFMHELLDCVTRRSPDVIIKKYHSQLSSQFTIHLNDYTIFLLILWTESVILVPWENIFKIHFLIIGVGRRTQGNFLLDTKCDPRQNEWMEISRIWTNMTWTQCCDTPSYWSCENKIWVQLHNRFSQLT